MSYTMTRFSLGAFGAWCAAALLAAAPSQAAPLYAESFEVDPSAAWTVNDPLLSDTLVNFSYDYSSIGVPTAPSGAGSKGLKLTANNSGGVFSGFSVSPTGKSFTGEYKVTFDLWQNYVGPLGPGGSGTTQLSTFGIGTSGTIPFWAGALTKESVAFAATIDGGSANDYRAYSTAAPTSYPSGNAVYNGATSNNNSNAYFAGFTPSSAPAAQLLLYPGQTGSTDVGEIAFKWRSVVIDVSGGFATWSVDGLTIAKVDLSTVTLGGSNIFFGHSDTNAGSSADANDTLLNITLIDNVSVTQVVPEPSACLLGLTALCGLLGLGRKSR